MPKIEHTRILILLIGIPVVRVDMAVKVFIVSFEGFLLRSLLVLALLRPVGHDISKKSRTIGAIVMTPTGARQPDKRKDTRPDGPRRPHGDRTDAAAVHTVAKNCSGKMFKHQRYSLSNGGHDDDHSGAADTGRNTNVHMGISFGAVFRALRPPTVYW